MQKPRRPWDCHYLLCQSSAGTHPLIEQLVGGTRVPAEGTRLDVPASFLLVINIFWVSALTFWEPSDLLSPVTSVVCHQERGWYSGRSDWG